MSFVSQWLSLFLDLFFSAMFLFHLHCSSFILTSHNSGLLVFVASHMLCFYFIIIAFSISECSHSSTLFSNPDILPSVWSVLLVLAFHWVFYLIFFSFSLTKFQLNFFSIFFLLIKLFFHFLYWCPYSIQLFISFLRITPREYALFDFLNCSYTTLQSFFFSRISINSLLLD